METLAQNIVYMMATKQSMSLEGNEWEQIFAECVGAEWKPSNVGLDDVVLDNCCWGAKTVFGQTDIEHQDKVRLICGRNAVTYSFGVDNYSEVDPNELGKMVLQIWNERVSACLLYTSLHQVLDLAVEDEYLRSNPSDNALKELKQSHNFDVEKRRALTVQEQNAFTAFLANSRQYNHWNPIFTVMLGTGLRLSLIHISLVCAGAMWIWKTASSA